MERESVKERKRGHERERVESAKESERERWRKTERERDRILVYVILKKRFRRLRRFCICWKKCQLVKGQKNHISLFPVTYCLMLIYFFINAKFTLKVFIQILICFASQIYFKSLKSFDTWWREEIWSFHKRSAYPCVKADFQKIWKKIIQKTSKTVCPQTFFTFIFISQKKRNKISSEIFIWDL